MEYAYEERERETERGVGVEREREGGGRDETREIRIEACLSEAQSRRIRENKSKPGGKNEDADVCALFCSNLLPHPFQH